jgi:hypothetical protein
MTLIVLDYTRRFEFAIIPPLMLNLLTKTWLIKGNSLIWFLMPDILITIVGSHKDAQTELMMIVFTFIVEFGKRVT